MRTALSLGLRMPAQWPLRILKPSLEKAPATSSAETRAVVSASESSAPGERAGASASAAAQKMEGRRNFMASIRLGGDFLDHGGHGVLQFFYVLLGRSRAHREGDQFLHFLELFIERGDQRVVPDLRRETANLPAQVGGQRGLTDQAGGRVGVIVVNEIGHDFG